MRKIYLFTVLIAASLSGSAQSFFGKCIEYDPAQNRFFSSQNGASIVQRAADGTISYFGDGLRATHGMEVMNNTLFTIHDETIYGYDLDSELQVMEITIAGTFSLDGMASDGIDRLWVTDFQGWKIYEIDVSNYQNPVSTEVVSNTNLGPTGIVFDGAADRLVFVNWGTSAPIKQVDLSDYSVSTIAQTSLDYIDGIAMDPDRNFYTSSWVPATITRFNTDLSISETITAPGISYPGDLCYAHQIDTLAIPNGDSTVTFLGLGPATGIADIEKPNMVTVGPNPLSSNSEIRFELQRPQTVRISMRSTTGQEVHVFAGRMSNGQHRVLLTGFDLASGAYVLSVETEEFGHSSTVLVE